MNIISREQDMSGWYRYLVDIGNDSSQIFKFPMAQTDDVVLQTVQDYLNAINTPPALPPVQQAVQQAYNQLSQDYTTEQILPAVQIVISQVTGSN